MLLCEVGSRADEPVVRGSSRNRSFDPAKLEAGDPDHTTRDVYDLAGLADSTVVHRLKTLSVRDRNTTAQLLAVIGEFEARKLHRPEAFPSTTAYCVDVLDVSEDVAGKRIHAARVARRHPMIFPMVADGRLHMTAVNMLGPYLKTMTAGSAAALLADAARKTKVELDLLLAERFPRTDLMPLVTPFGSQASSAGNDQPAPERVEKSLEVPGATASGGKTVPRPRVSALSSDGYAVQFTMSRRGHDDLRRAQELLSHRFAPGDIVSVIETALRLAVAQLEKRKYAATENPRAGRRRSTNARYIPAHVKRAVRERDGDQCTYVSPDGRRCQARTRLEFDHVVEAARGGQARVDGIRQRCREHNQFTAEQAFGRDFMERKRREARERRAESGRARAAQAGERGEEGDEAVRAGVEPERAEADDAAAARAEEAERGVELDVIAALRQLGYRATEAREAAAYSRGVPGAPVEQRLKVALSYFRPRGTSHSRPASTQPTVGHEAMA